jgi:hypothetical protein
MLLNLRPAKVADCIGPFLSSATESGCSFFCAMELKPVKIVRAISKVLLVMNIFLEVEIKQFFEPVFFSHHLVKDTFSFLIIILDAPNIFFCLAVKGGKEQEVKYFPATFCLFAPFCAYPFFQRGKKRERE